MSEPSQEPRTPTRRENRRTRKAYNESVNRGEKALKAAFALAARDVKRMDPAIRERIGRANLTKADLQQLAQASLHAEIRPDLYEQRRQQEFGRVNARVQAAGPAPARTLNPVRAFRNRQTRKRDLKQGTKALKGALAQAARDAKRMDPRILSAVGNREIDKLTLRNIAQGNLNQVFRPESSNSRQGQGQGQQAPVQAGRIPTREEQLLLNTISTLRQTNAGLTQQLAEVQQKLGEVQQQYAEIQQKLAEVQQQYSDLQAAQPQQTQQPEVATQQEAPAQPRAGAQPEAGAQAQTGAQQEAAPPQEAAGQQAGESGRGGRHRREDLEAAQVQPPQGGQPPQDPAQEAAARRQVDEAWVNPVTGTGTNAQPAVAGAEQAPAGAQQPAVAAQQQGGGSKDGLASDDPYLTQNVALSGTEGPAPSSPAQAQATARAGRGGESGQRSAQSPSANRGPHQHDR
jgi:hypothetical protein